MSVLPLKAKKRAFNIAQQVPSTFQDDCLPPEGEYDSRDSVLTAINAWAAPRGYAFRTGRTTREKSGKTSVTYVCDRAGKPPDPSIPRQRKTVTRATNCQFSILGKESYDRKTWTIRHRQLPQFSVHNHRPSLHPAAHPAHRKLSKDDEIAIRRLVQAGKSRQEIESHIEENGESMMTRQDLHNEIHRAKRESHKGQTCYCTCHDVGQLHGHPST